MFHVSADFIEEDNAGTVEDVSEECLKRKSLEGTNVLNEQREDSGEGGDVVRVWRKEATRS